MKKLIITACALLLFNPLTAPAGEKPMNEHIYQPSTMKTYAIRLRPDQDLRVELENFVRSAGLKAGFIITCVGSLKKASLRLANEKETLEREEKFEIVSLVGTLSPEGVHLHIALSDRTGKTLGGHLQKGSLIYTTAEIVIGEAENLVFSRPDDPETKFKELKVEEKKPSR